MGTVVGRRIAQDLEWLLLPPSDRLVGGLAQEARLQEQARIRQLLSGGPEYVYDLSRRMSDILMEKVGIFRNESGLREAVEGLRELLFRSQRLGLRSSGDGANPELAAALRFPGMVRLALTIAQGALNRTESRGSHHRVDYPVRDDDNWLTRTLAAWPTGHDAPSLTYEPVRITELPPGERGYGETRTAAVKEGVNA
tara:strand:+ start:64 stop:654 length:591 start_codon:yes stop_codon:yes gene_type:complete